MLMYMYAYMMILSMTHSFSKIIWFACLLALFVFLSPFYEGGYFTVSYRPAFTDSVTKSDF